jgi:hypothetical protein
MHSDFWLHPFALGLYLGLIFAALALLRSWRIGRELKRYQRHLSDKVELEGDAIKRVRLDQEALRKENENLRIKVAGLNEMPDRRVQRDLEIFARAEKRMLISAPGFAPAWENAKSAATGEIEEEEAGRSLPKRIFGKVFTAPVRKDALPAGEKERSVEA